MEGAGTGRLVWAPVPFMEGGSTVGLAVVVDIHYKAETSHDRRQQSSRNGSRRQVGTAQPCWTAETSGERLQQSRWKGGGQTPEGQSLGRVRREYVQHYTHYTHYTRGYSCRCRARAGEGGEGEQYEEEK